MGRAILTENLTEGKYKIESRYSSEAITARQTTIDQALADTEQQRVETQAALDAALLHMRVLNDGLNGVLSSTTLTLAEKETQSRALVTQQQAHRLVVLGFQTTLGSLAATRTSLQLEYLRLGKVPLTHKRTVWSADYSPDLGIAGIEVGTIEVPGEEQEVLLYPAKNQFRPWTPAIDGDLTPVAAQSPMAWLYNTCLVTGWQKYRPTYRFAKVLKILDADHMEVEIIDPLKSTYGDVDITPTLADLTKPLYTTVVCEYLDCNTAPFTEGDEVVVQYTEQNPDKPKVIGFRHHPKPCAQGLFFTPHERLTPSDTSWQRQAQTGQLYGNAYWSGKAGAVSWFGWSGRHWVNYAGSFDTILDPPSGPQVFSRGVLLATAPGTVRGAALTIDPAATGAKWVIVVCYEYQYGGAHSLPEQTTEYFYAKNLDDAASAWLLLHAEPYTTPPTVEPDYPIFAGWTGTPWMFNASGTQGVTVKRLGGWPDVSEDRTRLVQFAVTFVGGLPVGALSYPPIRHAERADTSTATDTLGGLGRFGSDGEFHQDSGQTWRWYDQIADYVDDTLVTADLVQTNSAQWDVVCGADILSLGDTYKASAGSGAVQSLTGSEQLHWQGTAAFVNDALGLHISWSWVTSDTLTWNVTRFSSYTDPVSGLTTWFPQYAYTSAHTQDQDGDVVEWLDMTSGVGKMQALLRTEDRHAGTTSGYLRQYTFDPSDGSVDYVDVPSVATVASTATGAVRLVSRGIAVALGTGSGDFDNPLTGVLWACADRQGHCLVGYAFFNTTVGAPDLGAPLTFLPVGLG